MIVRKLDTHLYEVKRSRTSNSWWTASNRNGTWLIITAQSMREVDPNGPAGKRIIKAVESHINR